MAHDWPDVPEMVRTAREFIEAVTPQLKGLERYHALCAAYLLEIVLRELGEWQPLETADDARLRDLAGAGPAVPRATLTARLAARIRAGEFDQRMDELLAALTAHVVAKAAISKPGYLDDEHRAR